MIQRWAMVSHSTTPWPSLFVWHPPPNTDHRVLVLTGPYSTDPVLLYTAMRVLAIWKYWVVPAAPWVSGGAEPLAAIPSKLAMGEGMRGFATVPLVSLDRTTFCGAPWTRRAGWERPGVVLGVMFRSGGDTSWWTSLLTMT